ncbi:MAG: hypothetical protein IT564_11985 [Rhodospirillales bacterium]|nr:hypothetical protein [Rhodospirillales bacterium]
MTCPTCNGRGKVWHDGITAQFFERCDRCNGSGWTSDGSLTPTQAVEIERMLHGDEAADDMATWVNATVTFGDAPQVAPETEEPT